MTIIINAPSAVDRRQVESLHDTQELPAITQRQLADQDRTAYHYRRALTAYGNQQANARAVAARRETVGVAGQGEYAKPIKAEPRMTISLLVLRITIEAWTVRVTR